MEIAFAPLHHAGQMQFSFIDLKSQFLALEAELMPAMRAVMEQSNFVLGGPVAEFEKNFAVYSECKHGIGVASGLDAIKLALRALGIGPGEEIHRDHARDFRGGRDTGAGGYRRAVLQHRSREN